MINNKHLSFEDCLGRVKRSLTKTEQIICEYMQANRADIIYQTIADVSEATDTSDASIIRFCRKLGFSGFQELKIFIARDVIPLTAHIHEDIDHDDPAKSIVHKVFSSIKDTLELTEGVLDSEQFEQAGNAILHAQHVVVFGLGSSAPVAMDVAHKFLRIGLHSTAYTDNHMQFLASCRLSEKDVAIGISHSGNSRDVVEALQLAKREGATTICFTNNSRSPITKDDVSDIKLCTASAETRYRVWGQASRIAQLAIADAIYNYVAFKLGEASISAVRKVDESLTLKKF